MRNKKTERIILSIFCLILFATICWAADQQSTSPTKMSPSSQPSTSTAPATQPAQKKVLIRFGDAEVITQADFEFAMRNTPIDKYEMFRELKINELVLEKMFALYVKDHPELVSEEEIQKELEKSIKQAKLKTIEELEKKLNKAGTTMQQFRERKRRRLVLAKIINRGVQQGNDEDYLKKLFKENPSDYDGTLVTARHIMIRVVPYHTPAQREERRRKLAKIREDLISGKRTWEECVKESHAKTRFKNGELGSFPRHMRLIYGEPVAKAAFELKIGEYSDIIEAPTGFHLVQTTGRVAGNSSYEKAKRNMKIWLQRKAMEEVAEEVRTKYPIIGVQAPTRPDFLKPIFTTTSRPATQPG